MKWSLVFLAFFVCLAAVAEAQLFQPAHEMVARRVKGQCAKYPELKQIPKLHERLRDHKHPTTSEAKVNETVEAIQQLFLKDEKILKKIKRRAHHLDKGFKLCGMRFGWTFIIGLVPFAGDIADALLAHNLIVKKAQQIEG
ncbi:hypothetical protein MCAP1_000664 [Malassezia caprae]|uniref:Uncharacterized protein n=1 Tax=Malassezia caprae TaxID=1381934 RepID=A0AAF0E5A1_9BASI|nr:hypothetical protein MCAP1_000664 [Malassezia caprae]